MDFSILWLFIYITIMIGIFVLNHKGYISDKNFFKYTLVVFMIFMGIQYLYDHNHTNTETLKANDGEYFVEVNNDNLITSTALGSKKYVKFTESDMLREINR